MSIINGTIAKALVNDRLDEGATPPFEVPTTRILPCCRIVQQASKLETKASPPRIMRLLSRPKDLCLFGEILSINKL